MSLNTTPRTFVAGETVTAAIMNVEIRDALAALQAATTSFAPVLTATVTNPTGFTGTGRFKRVGKYVTFWYNITAGAAFTAGSGTYNISLPVPRVAADNLIAAASCLLYDASAVVPNFSVSPVAGSGASVTTVSFQCLSGGVLATVTHAVPWAWAANDQMSGCLIYEAA